MWVYRLDRGMYRGLVGSGARLRPHICSKQQALLRAFPLPCYPAAVMCLYSRAKTRAKFHKYARKVELSGIAASTPLHLSCRCLPTHAHLMEGANLLHTVIRFEIFHCHLRDHQPVRRRGACHFLLHHGGRGHGGKMYPSRCRTAATCVQLPAEALARSPRARSRGISATADLRSEYVDTRASADPGRGETALACSRPMYRSSGHREWVVGRKGGVWSKGR